MHETDPGIMEIERIHLIYFVLDRSLKIIEKGKSMPEIMPDGMDFKDCFEVILPRHKRDLSFDKILSFRNRIFVLRAKAEKKGTFFRGEFMSGENDSQLMYYGIVWQPTPGQLKELGENQYQIIGKVEPFSHAVFHPDQMKVRFDKLNLIDASLLREKQRFEALFQYSSMAIIVSNEKGEVVLANKMAIQTFGYAQSDIPGMKVEDLIPSRFREKHLSHRERFHAQPSSRNMGQGFDLYAKKNDGSEFPVEISLGHYKTIEGHFVIAYIIDITKRREIEKAIMKQQEEMAKANDEIEKLNEELEAKVEQRTRQLQETLEILERSRDELEKALSKEKELSDLKTRFVSMASHEFRTPLSTILSSASLVAKYTLSEEQNKRDKHIQRIRSAVSNLTDILNEFLSIGRLEEGKIQVNFADFNLKEQVQLVCNEMQTIIRPGQKIRIRHTGNQTVNLDLSLLRNVIINLVSNAIKFSPENGLIDVETQVNPKQILISVRDNGIGISEDDKKHLFERFFRGKNATNIQGTGLGLHIVSKYIELMNGHMIVESELEEGTTFIIKFDI
jgi:PAS domain S-box-containing protein